MRAFSSDIIAEIDWVIPVRFFSIDNFFKTIDNLRCQVIFEKEIIKQTFSNKIKLKSHGDKEEHIQIHREY